MITLGTIDGRVLSRLEQNSRFYPASERYDAINEALQFVNLFTGYYQLRVPQGALTVANRVIYTVPAEILFPTNVYIDGVALHPTSIQSACDNQRDWLRGVVDIDPMYWIRIGVKMFAIVGVDPMGGRFIEVEGVGLAPEVTDPATELPLKEEYQDIVIDYAYMTLALDEGGKIFSDASMLYPSIQKSMKDLSMYEAFRWPKYWVETSVPRP